MIAIVPDPVRSRLPLFFDRTIDAIELAAESIDYVSDHYWLPWEGESKASFSDYESNIEAARDRLERQKEPGLMLFRWNGDEDDAKPKPKLLYVFLVGDSPAAGINGVQFSRAVQYIDDVCNKERLDTGCAQRDDIRVMGPTFSGSLTSLVRLAEAENQHSFISYSGTVSSQCASENLHLREWSEFSPCTKPQGPGHKSPERLKFRSFVNSSEFSAKRFLAFLVGKRQIRCNNGPPEVAILSEAGTTYGSATKTTVATQESSSDAKKDAARKNGDCPYVSFSYPREISSLRNAYQSVSGEAPPAGKNSDVARSYLPLNLSEQFGEQGDKPSDFSTQQSPLSKEAVLMKYAAELRRSRYRYIGITGSNFLDILFLTRFLRASYPDSRVFVLDADVMLARETDATSYIGTLVITTYPLIGENLEWTLGQEHWHISKRRARLPFSDQFEQGQYNASLLTVREMLNEDGPELYESRAPFSRKSQGVLQELPLWVEAVGTGGYWPVEILSDPSRAGNPDPALAYLPLNAFSFAWRATAVLLTLNAFLHILILLTTSPIAHHFRGFALIRPVSAQRLFFIHCAGSSLALALFMLTEPWFSYGGPKECVIAVICATACVAIAGLLLASIFVTINYALRWRRDVTEHRPGCASRRKVLWQIFSFFVVWIAAATTAAYWYRMFDKSDVSSLYGFFFAYRTIHLSTGVSPVVPMLLMLAGIYLWSIFSVWRLRFNDSVRPRLNPRFVKAEVSSLPGMQREKLVARAISYYFLQRKYVLAFAIVYIIWLLMFRPFSAFELFERREFEWIYESMLFVLMAMMLSQGLRFGQIWSELRDLLFELETSRIRIVFSRLKYPGWSPIWNQGGEEAEFISMVHSLETLQQIKNGGSAFSSEVHQEMAGVEAIYEATGKAIAQLRTEKGLFPTYKLFAEYRQHERKLTRQLDILEMYFVELQDRLAVLLYIVWQSLEQHWNEDSLQAEESEESGSNSEHGEQAERLSSKMLVIRRLEEYVALRYVAFLRGALIHMKHSLIFLGISFSLVLLSLNIYSFEPHQSLIWSLTIIFFVIGGTVVRALMQMHRNHILSVITGTEPNELGQEFYVRVVGYGAVPLLTLIATHFPSIGHYLVALLQPGLEALK
jgi:hypothetical protein